MGEVSACRFSLMFLLTACSYKPDVVWLDEAAEALRNCANGLNAYLLARQNSLPKVRKQLEVVDTFHKSAEQYQRMVYYSIGVLAYHLARLNKDETATRRNLSKLNILQGGVEPRFIPTLSAETKRQIEGSYKITNDKDLQSLALKNENEIVLEPSDQLYLEIMDSAKT